MIKHSTWTIGDIYSNTVQVDGDVMTVLAPEKQHYYSFCQASIDQAKAWADSHIVYYIYLDGHTNPVWVCYAWKGDKHATNPLDAFNVLLEDIHEYFECDRIRVSELL